MLKFVLLLIYLNLVLGDIECPPNYLLFEDGLCYQFLSEAAVHKIPGQHKCESEGGNLPKISGILQNAIVTNISLNATDVTWLGLTCSRDDTCIWDDGTKMNYSNFDSGLADVSQGNCVFINILPAKRGKWSSADCASDLKDVICQTNPLQPNITCPDTYIKGSDDRCYLSPNFKLEFNNAENLCSETASNSHLTSISSREENNATQLISQAAHFTDIFIGLEAGSKGYVWIDGTQFNYPYSYSNFEDGQPNIKVGNCVAMNVTTGKWKSICCNQKTSFVCLQKFISSSSSTTTTTTTSTTTTTTTSPPTTTTTQPYHTYICGNGTISSPGYPERYPNSLNATYILQATPGKVVRITFNYINTEQNYDNITLFDGLFEDESNFITNLSGSPPTPQHFQSKGTFMTVRFLTDASFPAGGFTADFVSIDDSISKTHCPNGWIHDSSMNYCYKYFSTYLSWRNSSSSCKNQGAQLLAIHNSTQEFFIETIYKSQIGMQDSLVWIGLRYFKLENPSYWGWSDGTLLGYAKWLSDDNYNECGAIQVLRNQNGWKSVSCDAKLPYICYQKAVEF